MPDVPDFPRNPKGSPRRGTPRGSSPRIGSARPNAGAARSAARRQATKRPGARPRNRVGSEKPRPSRRQPAPVPLIMCAIVLFALVGIIVSCIPKAAPSTGDDADAPAQPASGRVHFVAVGDNLPEDRIGAWADAQAGTTGDGLYDYTAIYEPIKGYIESADLAYVKEETHCGGDDIGPAGYPSFNTTDAMADALVATGFDLVGSASNHSYDWGYFGANDHSCALWKKKNVVFTGTASSEADASRIATIERNGITFALLDYTYGVNGYEASDLPSYAVNFIDKNRIAADVSRAREQADVVLVAMHWGTENLMEADDYQTEYAQYLADLGVDVVLGSHPHVIGPMTWLNGKDGHRTLVAYSLGNFLSRHESPQPKNELEGMLSCDFVRGENGSVGIENVVWTPLVNYTDGQTYAVYAVKDFTNELAANDAVFSGLEDPVTWLKQTSAEVVGDGFQIDA